MADRSIMPSTACRRLFGELVLSCLLARFPMLIVLAGKTISSFLLWLGTVVPGTLRGGEFLWHNLPWILATIDASWRLQMLASCLTYALGA